MRRWCGSKRIWIAPHHDSPSRDHSGTPFALRRLDVDVTLSIWGNWRPRNAPDRKES